MQLHWEVYFPVLEPHPLFYSFTDVDEPGVMAVCHHTMREVSCALGHEVFSCGTSATDMIFACQGQLHYFHGTLSEEPMVVNHHEHLCEMPLWLQWDHRGRLNAVTVCELVTLDAFQFRLVVRKTGGHRHLHLY